MNTKALLDRLAYGTAICTVFAGLGLAIPVHAQETDDTATPDDEETIEERFVVTGSRIQRSTASYAQPVTVIDAGAIERSGEITLGELLNDLPALRSTFGTGNSDRFIGTAGLAALDLRGLGTQRTLVLVDGRRHVSSTAGSQRVDINTVPSALIERVEVLTGGASAVYGADAVTGVVNLVLKDDFEGIDIGGQIGSTTEWDGEEWALRATLGGNFADDKGNAVFHISYDKIEAIIDADRPHIADNRRTVSNPNDNPQDICGTFGLECAGDLFTFSPVTGNGIQNLKSIRGAQLNFVSINGTILPANFGAVILGAQGLNGGFTFGNDGSVIPYDFGDVVSLTESINPVGGLPNSILEGLGQSQVPQDRLNMYGKVSYEFFPWLNFFASGKYTNTVSGPTLGQPSFDFQSALPIQIDNAYLPGEIRGLMADAGLDFVHLQRFHTDLGLRQEEVERQTYRVVTGFEGTLPHNLRYEAAYVYGRTTIGITNFNNRINGNFLAAADAVVDPADGQVKCRNQVASAQPDGYVDPAISGGCQPLNLFGFGKSSQQAIDFAFADTQRSDAIEQQVATFFISGDTADYLELPHGGPIGFAAGFEWREETAVSRPAPLDSLGLTFGNQLQKTEGSFDVRELFAEVNVPLIKDQWFTDELSLEAAVRYSEYSTVGETVAWKAGGQWAVTEDIRFRGVYSIAVRAPNISELFGPQNQNFFNVNDPCSETQIAGIGDANRAARRRANCEALGRPDGFESSADDATLPGISGGNPDLGEEDSTSYTVGAVVTPRWIPYLTLAADFWNIEIIDAIQSVTAQTILDRCVDSGPTPNGQFCSLVTRDANFEITNIEQISQNIAKLTARGIDIEASYFVDLADVDWSWTGDEEMAVPGTLTFRAIATWLDELRQFPFQDEDDFDEIAGELGDPRWNANFNVVYVWNDLELNWESRFIDSQVLYELGPISAQDPEEIQAPFETGTVWFHDIRVAYTLPSNVTVYAGMDNVFDRLPPARLSGSGANSAIYLSGAHGRSIYAGASIRF